MIPKQIHYCWFGRNPLPETVTRCIDSWKKYCPEYSLNLWTEDNFNIHCHPYIEEAYQKKRWAFVSDLARLLIVYENGGIYLDTDVELIAPLDIVLDNSFFLAIEKSTNTIDGSEAIYVNTGLGFGGEKNNDILQSMIAQYDGCHFIKDDGKLDLTPCPHRNTLALNPYGYAGKDELMVFNGGTIYPSEYFCPMDYSTRKMRVTDNTISIHHYDASWISEREKVRESMKTYIKRIVYKIGGYQKIVFRTLPLSCLEQLVTMNQVWLHKEAIA